VFIGAAFDRYLRAFDARSGAELWAGRLPAAGVATPMSYQWQGRQYVVVAAGGRADAGIKPGDAIVAFALPQPGESGPSLLSRFIDRPGGRFAAGVAVAALLLAFAVWAVFAWRTRRGRVGR
jgi:quinoprotein glucose dehydrogenase